MQYLNFSLDTSESLDFEIMTFRCEIPLDHGIATWSRQQSEHKHYLNIPY